MVPAGVPTEAALRDVAGHLESGDIVIDGGNTYYRDDVRRAGELRDRGIRYVDCGTSGGVFGLERGFCLMVGADVDVFEHLEPIFASLAPGVEPPSGREAETGTRPLQSRATSTADPSGRVTS